MFENKIMQVIRRLLTIIIWSFFLFILIIFIIADGNILLRLGFILAYLLAAIALNALSNWVFADKK